MSENDSLTSALIDSNQAQNILEKTNPTKDELKEAVKLFKKAAKTLACSVYLEENDINTVRPEPNK